MAEQARPAEVPNQYQLLSLRADGVTRHTRAYLVDRRTWTGDNRADLVADTWHHTEPVALAAPAALATPVRPAGRSKDEDQSDRDALDDQLADAPVTADRRSRGRAGTPYRPELDDPFLHEVAIVTRLRHDGADVQVYDSAAAGRSYLVVTRRDEFGPVDRWPVGAVPGQVTQELLDTVRCRGARPTAVLGSEPTLTPCVRRPPGRSRTSRQRPCRPASRCTAWCSTAA